MSREKKRAVRRWLIVPMALFGALASGLHAQGSLFFLELRAVGAYSTSSCTFELFSLIPADSWFSTTTAAGTFSAISSRGSISFPP